MHRVKVESHFSLFLFLKYYKYLFPLHVHWMSMQRNLCNWSTLQETRYVLKDCIQSRNHYFKQLISNSYKGRQVVLLLRANQ